MHAAIERAVTVVTITLSGIMFGQSAEPESASVCVAPVFEKANEMSSPGLFCKSEKLSFKIDTQSSTSFPLISEHHGRDRIGNSVKIEGLDPAIRHRVVVYCHGKPQQSFTFRFSEFNTRRLCLFINDLYKTAQLWEAKRCPWCTCK